VCLTKNGQKGICAQYKNCIFLQELYQQTEKYSSMAPYDVCGENKRSQTLHCCIGKVKKFPDRNSVRSECVPAAVYRIVGGETTGIREAPYTALIQYEKYGSLVFNCAGVLLNSRYVLTAAHCVSRDKM
jgi:hypothetical protein